MSKKKRGFDIDLPDMDADLPVEKAPEPERKRGPMASAIAENADALNDRAAAEAQIRAENDALAHEYVKLKDAGLIQKMIPLDSVVTEALVRDRNLRNIDYELDELVSSIREVGLSNPIRVEERGDGKYELVQGFRRWSAYKKLQDMEGDFWSEIPAGILPRGEGQGERYRRMVDENIVRKELSFAEMAVTAINYAADPDTEISDLDAAVAALFKSTGYQKRSYIRTFARLMTIFEKDLMFPEYISRNLGLAVMKRIDEDRGTVDRIRADIAPYGETRGVQDELNAMRKAINYDEREAGEGSPASAAAVAAGSTGRKPRTTFEFGKGRERVRCTVSDGQMTLKMNRDLSLVDRGQLEASLRDFLDSFG